MLVKIKNLLYFFYYRFLIKVNPLIKQQRRNPLSIPIIIISFNQLFYLEKLINFLLNRKFENIIIIDNNSTYPPLLDYLKKIKSKVKIEFMDKNGGHKVFFNNKELLEKYGKGYYVITDADIVPNDNLPENFMNILISKMDKFFRGINKIGFALKIDDIPDYYPLKDKVINWEKQFWKYNLEDNIYKAAIDTTFALYKPNYPKKFNNKQFVEGIRLSENFEARHGGWYIDENNISEETKYYFENATNSSSWKFNESGNLDDKLNDVY